MPLVRNSRYRSRKSSAHCGSSAGAAIDDALLLRMSQHRTYEEEQGINMGVEEIIDDVGAMMLLLLETSQRVYRVHRRHQHRSIQECI